MHKINLEDRICLQKLDFLFSELPKALISLIFVGLFLIYVLKDDVSQPILLIWYASNVIVSLMRYLSCKIFKSDTKKALKITYYQKIFFSGLLLSSLIWGSSVIFFIHQSDGIRILVLFCIAGLSSGATGSTSAIYGFFQTYVLVYICPFIAVLLIDATENSILMAFLLGFYLIAIINTGKKISINFDNSLRLSHQNDALVDELKEKAALAQHANDAKTRFLSNMSHEIRTPLNAILGYISILQTNETNEKKCQQLKIIEHSSHQLLGVINDILDFNKISTGHVELELIPCDLTFEVSQISQLFLPVCDAKNIQLIDEIDPNIPKRILSDPLRISQILTNLLSNAVKFSPIGSSVKIRVYYIKPKVHFEIADTGIGIDKAQQKSIFKSFKQADSSTTREYGGTGLGLAISHKLAALFGSELTVVSALGHGSTFSFIIDAKLCETPTQNHSEKPAQFKQQQILIAEDNNTNQLLIQILLENVNLSPSIVANGQLAIDEYNDQYALVLMDINMPTLNGIEAMKSIKRKHPQSVIIALTANALRENKNKYLKSGFDDYLTKPIQVKKLYRVLQKYLETDAINTEKNKQTPST